MVMHDGATAGGGGSQHVHMHVIPVIEGQGKLRVKLEDNPERDLQQVQNEADKLRGMFQ